MNDFEKLLCLANIVRKAFEKANPNNVGLSNCCSRASTELFHLAKKNGINIEIAGNYIHTFCIFNDKIVDVTATQFGVPASIAVYNIDEVFMSYHYNIWEIEWRGDTIEKAEKAGGWDLRWWHVFDERIVKEELSLVYKDLPWETQSDSQNSPI